MLASIITRLIFRMEMKRHRYIELPLAGSSSVPFDLKDIRWLGQTFAGPTATLLFPVDPITQHLDLASSCCIGVVGVVQGSHWM